jgi:N-hydroxyarylamine O-acetyltransferase
MWVNNVKTFRHFFLISSWKSSVKPLMMSTKIEFSLANYMQRIGMATTPRADLATLSSIMIAHSEAIAFENIDVVLGRTVSMAESDVVKKLVDSGRGGYCFEQNTLLAMALESIGFDVTPVMCRVRWGKAPDDDGPNTTYTHLALKVALEDGSYLADVGFAGVNSVAPVRLGTRDEQALPEGRFRIVDGTSPLPGYSVLQLLVKGEWRSVYTWRDDVFAPIVDQECSNWFSCTHPTARFTNSFFACRVVGDQRHHILNGEYVIRTGHGVDSELESTLIRDKDALLELLEGVFNIRLGKDDMEGPLGSIDRYLPKL